MVHTNPKQNNNRVLSFTEISSLQIVIIEDDKEDSAFLCDALIEVIPAARLHWFTNAVMAFDYLNRVSSMDFPVLIILDINLPITSGLQVLRILDNNPKFARVAKVVYSHSSHPKEKEACLLAGAEAFIRKASSPADIKKDVLQILSFCHRTN